MPSIQTTNLTKLYYTIGEVGRLFDVNASLLRFWEKEFNLSVGKKNAKGNRMYSVSELSQLNQIYILVKERGFTHDGAKKQLKLKKITVQSDSEKHLDVIHKLEQIRNRLIALRNEGKE